MGRPVMRQNSTHISLPAGDYHVEWNPEEGDLSETSGCISDQ